MKRKKQTILFLVLILGFSVFLIRFWGLFWDREELFYACERGALCGPSEEIIYEEERADGSVLMMGRQEEALYLLSAEPFLGIFWKYQNGGDNGYFPLPEEIDGYLLSDGRYLGLCRVPEVTEVEIFFGVWRDRKAETITLEVKEGGLLYADTGLDGLAFLDWCLRGKNAAGEVIYERWRQGYHQAFWEELQREK